MERPSDLVPLGIVAGAHGIAGEVRVHPFNPQSTNLERARRLWLRDADGRVRVARVTRTRRHKQFFLFKLEGIDDRNAALAARRQEVLLPREELAATEEDEYYHLELLGMEVLSESGGPLGKVEEIFETGSNAVLVVRRPGARRGLLVPFTEDAVVRVDRDRRRLVVRRRASVAEA